jgi:hypothetical protein
MTHQRLLNVRWHIEHPIALPGHLYIPTSRLRRDSFALRSVLCGSGHGRDRLAGLGSVPSGVKVFIYSVARLRARAPHYSEGNEWMVPRTKGLLNVPLRYRFASTLTPAGVTKTQRGAAARQVERCAVADKQRTHYELPTRFRAGFESAPGGG